MKKLLTEKITGLISTDYLSKVRGQSARLLPQSAPRSAVQLPVPKTPFEQYRREKLIGLLGVQYLASGKSVLEIGCGVGDLLLEISRYQPRELFGVEASAEILEHAKLYLQDTTVDLCLASVQSLPFPEMSFDLVILMAELQHILEEEELRQVIAEVCRLSRQWVVIAEETALEEEIRQNLALRSVATYKTLFREQDFFLRSADFLNIGATSYVFTGKSNPWLWIRWFLSPLLYLLGFPRSWMKPPLTSEELPSSSLAMFLQKLLLPAVAALDDLGQRQHGTTIMRFERRQLFRRK